MRRLNLNQIRTPDEFMVIMDALTQFVENSTDLEEDEHPPRRLPHAQVVLDRMEAEFVEAIGDIPPGGGDLTDEELGKLPVLDMSLFEG